MVRVKLPKPPAKRGRKPLELLTIEKPDIRDREKFLEYVKMRIIQFHDHGLDYSIYRIAEEFNVCPKTVKNYLRKYGIKYAEFKIQVINEYLKQKEETKKKLEELKTIAKLPVESRKDFYNREIVRELMKRLDDQVKLGNLTRSYRSALLNAFYKLCVFAKQSPEFFVESDRNTVFGIIRDLITYYASLGRNVDSLIGQLQGLENWLGVTLLPPEIKQREYTGKYNQVWLNIIIRNRMVELILHDYMKGGVEIKIMKKRKMNNQIIEKEVVEKYTRKDLVDLLKVMVFLFYTGSRKQAIKDHSIMSKVRIDTEITRSVYGETEFYIVKTHEKGKRGRKLVWDKLIPESYGFCLQGLKEINTSRLTPLMKHYIKLAFEEFKERYKNNIEYQDMINQIEVYLRIGKVFHIWRHTSAHEFLKAFNYNMLVVSKLLGWKKSDNLKIYADPTIYQLLQTKTEYSIVEFCSRELYEKIIQIIQV